MNAMRSLCIVWISVVLGGCQGAGTPVPSAASVQTFGTETHGGDIVVAAAKANAYRIIEETKDDTSVWENSQLSPESAMMAISKLPVFTDGNVGSLFSLGKSPRRHVILKRSEFMDPKDAFVALDRVARDLILQVAADSDVAVLERMATNLDTPRHGSAQFHMRTESYIPGTALDFFTLFKINTAETVRHVRLCKDPGTGRIPAQGIRRADFLNQMASIEKLIDSVPVIATREVILDPEFGYRLDAQAVLAGADTRIEIDVSRNPPALPTNVFELHEYSHLMKLHERDRHYLFSYAALDCS